MIKYLDGTFSSRRLEEQYKAEQLNGIIQLNKIFQMLLILTLFSNGILQAIKADYITPTFMLILAILSFAQLKYFTQKPSLTCLKCINIFNVCFALYRFTQIKYITQAQSIDRSEIFVQAVGYFAIHLSLLVNTCLSQNIIVISIIFLVHYTVLTIQQGSFNYYALGLIGCIFFYISRLDIELKIKRKMFILQKEQLEWANIIKSLIDYPYLILTYNQDEIKFCLKHANQLANSEFQIHDSETMRHVRQNEYQKVLRQMSHTSKNTKFNNDFETEIFNQVKNMEQIDINNEEYSITFNRVKYAAQIFVVQLEPITLLITFKNQRQSNFENQLQQTIINQQIACCNSANSQLRFCRSIEQSVRRNNYDQIRTSVIRNIFKIHNLLAIFKTNHNINTSYFSIEKQMIRLSQLYSKPTFIFGKGSQICRSDLKIFRQITSNIFSLFINSQIVTVDIQSQSRIYFMKFYSYPIRENIYKILNQTNQEKAPLSHLNKVQTQAQLNFSIILKYLQIVSPTQKIELIYDKEQCKLYEIQKNLYRQTFKSIKILHFQTKNEYQIHNRIKSPLLFYQIHLFSLKNVFKQ